MRFHFGKLTLRTRILFIILLASLPAAGLFVLASSRQYEKSLREAENALMTMARLAASNESKVVQGIKDTLIAISEQPFIQNLDLPTCRTKLASLTKLYPAYDNFSFIDANGNILCAGIPLAVPINVRDRPYFVTMQREQRFVGGAYLVSRVTGLQAASFTLPLLHDGKFNGAITTALHLDEFAFLARDILLPAGTVIVITDPQGIVLTRQPFRPDTAGKPVPAATMGRSLSLQQPHFLEAQGIDGIHRLFAVVPSLFEGRPFFYVYVGLDKSLLAKAARKSLATNLGVLALIVLLSYAGTWLLSRRFLLHPLQRMIAAAQGVSAGDLTTRTGLNHEAGDIGELARHFDAMAHALEVREQANRSASQYIEYIAQHDPLTNLPNRRLLGISLEQQIARMKAAGQPLAVLFINLDRFRLINDSMGQAVGDQLLLTVAMRLEDGVPPESTVAHLGRDEFIGIIPGVGAQEVMSGGVQALVRRMTEPFFIDGERIEIGATVGVSLFPEHNEDGPTLVRFAEVAMHEAKESSTPIRLYSPDMGAIAIKRRVLETELRRALANREFLLVYQPKVDARGKHIVGAEALLRWQHPEKGLLSPAGYIRLAEEIQLIVPIGEWVLRTACLQNKAWQDAGLPPIQIAVNVSAHQFKDPAFVDTVKRALDDSKLDAHYLELEITEGAFLHGSCDVLHGLRRMGIMLAIDDFGTGYSNLGYLKELPVDKLKIDQSFIRDIVRDPNDVAVTRAIINVAQSLNLKVVAEGVEDRPTFDILEQLHCDEIQGYYCGKPQLPEDFSALLQSGHAVPHG
ncbi:EAL domain-containing protein [Janthinobacterium sp. 17J80-10]|uniref:bifunctional diguanylate cyclase/phosphodiesterase n=1 Tax=Janthinobacterium sp. 17J80-10 TaxID=2497863 RepID=UPI0010057590|nr:EAL domain-containing protein [Janthinobacterium sp. 17J80-10]QAU33095.1 EAL domain-containing protein [Janthinobacterium sp. 17J80-10]